MFSKLLTSMLNLSTLGGAMKFFIYLFFLSILVSCGGSNNTAASSPAPVEITGLQGDIEAIEPLNID